MTIGKRAVTVLAAITIIAVAVPCFTAQPPSADESVGKDRTTRQTVQSRKRFTQTPKWGFFGTIFHLILEQVNDTKSAYSQISDLVNGQFTDDEPGVTAAPDSADNGTTPTPKISRAEFLKILERNLKGLQRLRNLEWREAKRTREQIYRGTKKKYSAEKNHGRDDIYLSTSEVQSVVIYYELILVLLASSITSIS